MDIVRACRPDAKQPIFVLGGRSWRVSLHIQQKRAIALVDAVRDQIPKGSSVAVVGGGVAGVTCAAALVRHGYSVSLFERTEMLMSLQRKNTTRFIHPNSVTWPYTGLESSTRLPFLNWHSAYSDEVASIIKDQFDAEFVGPEYEGIEVALNTEVLSIQKRAKRYLVSYRNAQGNHSDNFDAVFIASGFRSERKVSGYDNFSYWEDTSPIPLGASFDKMKVAIVGDGDGALVELLRCGWGGANLDELYRFIADKFLPTPLRQQIVEEEEGARQQFILAPEAAQQSLANFYRDDLLTANGKSYLRKKWSSIADITIISKFAQPFSPKASPIHKILLGFALSEKLMSSSMLEVNGVTYDSTGYTVHGVSSGRADSTLGPFSRVLERIGPEKQYCSLIHGTFSADAIAGFSDLNALELDAGNPLDVPDVEAGLVQGPFSSRQPILTATQNLERYFRSTYPNRLMSVSLGKGKEGQPCFIATYNVGNDDIKRDGPGLYLGLEIKYEGGPGPARGLSGQTKELPMVPENDGDTAITAGQIVTNMSRPDSGSFGRIGAFVTPNFEDVRRQEIYFLTTAHSLNAQQSDKIGLQGGGRLRKIGRLEASRFYRKLSAWQSDQEFSCLKDVAIVKVDSDLLAFNKAGPDVFRGLKSPTDHFFNDDGSVYIKGKRFGNISRVRASTVFTTSDGNTVRTMGFFVNRIDPSIRISQGSSGRPVLTREGDLLGMIVAGTDTEVFCLDMQEVLSKLDFRLIKNAGDGVDAAAALAMHETNVGSGGQAPSAGTTRIPFIKRSLWSIFRALGSYVSAFGPDKR